VKSNNSNGCLYGIVVLALFYLGIFIYAKVVDTLVSNLPGPVISIGIPILIVVVLNYLNKNKDSEDDNKQT
jgi:uncharacterized membrane protein